MLKIKIIIFLHLLFALSVNAQVERIDIYLGASEDEVHRYLDSLNNLKQNPAYKIQRTTTPLGDLQLRCDFSIKDESFYKCLSIIFVFDRIQGKEYCVQQLIAGSPQFAYSHLSFIKDRFKSVTENNWILKTPAKGYIYRAVYTTDTKNGKNDFYTLQYILEKED